MADGHQTVDLGIAGLGPAVRIGSGGFADVYRAEQQHLRREVAVKVLRAPASDTQSRMRFERECHAVGAVSGHPNIVGVHGGGFTGDGRAYLVMEFCPGGSLLDRIQRAGPMAAPEVIEIGTKIGKALGVAHDAGVLHRDVKPANILVTAFGEPALADFGIARVEGGQQTATGMVTASFVHAAPEVLEGAHPTTGSDLYSLGSTMFELFTGRAPHFRPDDESVWALMNRVLREPVPDPASIGMPEPLASVIRRATLRAIDHRYAAAADFVTDLGASATTYHVAGPPRQQHQPHQPLPPPIQHPQQQPVLSLPHGDPGLGFTANLATESLPVDDRSAAVAPPVAAGYRPSPPRGPRPGRRVALAVVLVIAVVAAGAGAWYYLRPAGGQGALSLSFPEGASGPLDEGVSYELSVEGDPGGSASFRLVVDSEPIGSPQPTLESFAPPAGRHSVAVEVTRDSSVEITDPIEIYVIGELPEAGYRVNLVSVTADPASWSTAISAFDRLVAEGHTELSLLPSDRFASLLSGYWNLFVPGFGDNQDQAEAYCESFGLEIPHECFASRFDPNA